MQLEQASNLASKILSSMRSFCQRAEIAGSIRREKPDVKDIEIVAIPRYGEPKDLFGEEPANLLYDWARRMEREERIHWIKPGTSEIVRWPLKAEGKYWRGWLVKAEIKMDLFLTTPETWGTTFLIRTGSSEFNIRVVGEIAKRAGLSFSDGKLYDHNGQFVPTPEERDVFEALGLDWLEPKERK